MLFLLLSILCSTCIAIILKYNDIKKGELIVLLAGNYFIASSIALILLLTHNSKSFSYPTLLYGATLGFLFVITFFLLAYAIKNVGTGLAIASSRLSVIIPIILSSLFLNESPSDTQFFGFILTLITFFLFYFSVRSGHKDGEGLLKYFFLVAIFFGIGINDFALKFFKVWRSDSEEPFLIFFIFFSALIYSKIYIIAKKIRIEQKTVIRGLVLGVPNVFTAIFLLEALALLPTILVFPVMNIGIILLTTVMAFLIWKEKINQWGIFALVSG